MSESWCNVTLHHSAVKLCNITAWTIKGMARRVFFSFIDSMSLVQLPRSQLHGFRIIQVVLYSSTVASDVHVNERQKIRHYRDRSTGE